MKSAVFFSHWDGMNLVKAVKSYLSALKKEVEKSGNGMPLYRLEPGTVMVDFVHRYMALRVKHARVEGNYYITCSEKEGDNSDNGHYVFHLDTGKVMHEEYEEG